MHSRNLLLVLLLKCALTSALPLWYNKDIFWRLEDQLKRLGMYPRIFRYGTRSSPAFDGLTQSPHNWGEPVGWIDTYPQDDPRPVFNTIDSWQQTFDGVDLYRHDDEEYGKMIDERLWEIERETEEVIWSW